MAAARTRPACAARGMPETGRWALHDAQARPGQATAPWPAPAAAPPAPLPPPIITIRRDPNALHNTHPHLQPAHTYKQPPLAFAGPAPSAPSLTHRHSDLRMAPLDTNHLLTAWLPLRPIAGGGAAASTRRAGPAAAAAAAGRDSGLMFAVGSHRDFALPFWHEMSGRDLSDRGYEVAGTGPMEPGDVSWHHGWTVHAAGAQPRGTPPRLALAVRGAPGLRGCSCRGFWGAGLRGVGLPPRLLLALRGAGVCPRAGQGVGSALGEGGAGYGLVGGGKGCARVACVRPRGYMGREVWKRPENCARTFPRRLRLRRRPRRAGDGQLLCAPRGGVLQFGGAIVCCWPPPCFTPLACR